MGLKSRRKGASAEREVAQIIRAALGRALPKPDQVRRNLSQYQSDEEADLGGVPNWTIEVKRHKETYWPTQAWWDQVVAAANKANNVPCLWFRADRDQWKVAIPLNHVAPWLKSASFAVMHHREWLAMVMQDLTCGLVDLEDPVSTPTDPGPEPSPDSPDSPTGNASSTRTSTRRTTK